MTQGDRQMWQKIKTAPKNGEKILCCFKGQFGYVYFVCDAYGENTRHAGYAKPEYWQFIEECTEE